MCARLIIFPMTCVYAGISTFSSSFLGVADALTAEVMYVPIIAMLTMMGLLIILHFFWTYYIAQSFCSVAITKKISHNYD